MVVPGRIDERVRDRIVEETRGIPLALLELQLAAADPVGEPLPVWRAAELLGIHPEAATPAVDADLVEFGAQVRFRHPLLRSAAYEIRQGDPLNGIGRYQAAREAARLAFEHREHVGFGLFVVAELAEAASRTGDQALVQARSSGCRAAPR